jgi:hypothetical protein
MWESSVAFLTQWAILLTIVENELASIHTARFDAAASTSSKTKGVKVIITKLTSDLGRSPVVVVVLREGSSKYEYEP